MSTTIKITKAELRDLVKEVYKENAKAKKINEKIDHEAARQVVTAASRLLKAVEAFKADAPPSALGAVEGLTFQLSRHLENMIDNTLSYIEKPDDDETSDAVPLPPIENGNAEETAKMASEDE